MYLLADRQVAFQATCEESTAADLMDLDAEVVAGLKVIEFVFAHCGGYGQQRLLRQISEAMVCFP